jgi:hypothetical protein
MSQPGNNDELRKAITSALIQGEPFILLDNVTHLKAPALSAALTAEFWIDRILGQSKLVRLRNDAIWLATGNNVALSPEQTRRTVQVRLDARIERPEFRSDWKHPLPIWAREHRVELVSAALSLITHWAASGMPRSNATLGRFEEWASIVGGILETADVGGFLTGREALHAASDTETSEWIAFCSAWWEVHHRNAVTAKDLLQLSQQADLLLGVRAGHSLLASQQRLGHALRTRRDRVFGRFVIRHAGSDSGTGNSAYSLEAAKTPETPAPPPERGDQAVRGESVLAGVSENTPQNPRPSNGGNSTLPDGSGVSGVSSQDRQERWSEIRAAPSRSSTDFRRWV